MRKFHSIWLIAFLSGLLAGVGRAAEFKLANGNVLRGEVASADEDGLVVKLEVGGFSKREPWINFSQESLKEVAKDPKVAPLVEPFIELEPEQIKAREKQKEIVVRPVPNRLERPVPKPGLAAAFLTPLGLTLLAVLMLANLYAGYEIALFRQQPVGLVCGLSVLLPGIVPLIFLSLPARVARSTAEPAGGGAAAEAHGEAKVCPRIVLGRGRKSRSGADKHASLHPRRIHLQPAVFRNEIPRLLPRGAERSREGPGDDYQSRARGIRGQTDQPHLHERNAPAAPKRKRLRRSDGSFRRDSVRANPPQRRESMTI